MTELERVRHMLEELDFSAWRFAEGAYDSWLDLRDSDEFDASWMSAHLSTKERETSSPLGQDELEIVNHIREMAFLKTIRATGHSELAAYVSDDFELMARAARIGFEDRWLRALSDVYQQERFPYGMI